MPERQESPALMGRVVASRQSSASAPLASALPTVEAQRPRQTGGEAIGSRAAYLTPLGMTGDPGSGLSRDSRLATRDCSLRRPMKHAAIAVHDIDIVGREAEDILAAFLKHLCPSAPVVVQNSVPA